MNFIRYTMFAVYAIFCNYLLYLSSGKFLSLKECALQQQTEGLLSTDLCTLSETPHNLITDEHESGLINRPIDGDLQAVVGTGKQVKTRRYLYASIICQILILLFFYISITTV